jgi:hypothetical protein
MVIEPLARGEWRKWGYDGSLRASTMEQLAGRLNWERTRDGIRLEFPAIRNLKALAGTLRAAGPSALGGWVMGFFLVVALQFFFTPAHGEPWWMTPAWIASGLALGDLWAKLPSRWIVTLNRDYLWLTRRRLPWQKKETTFSTGQLHDLRFVRTTPGADIRNPYRLDEIQFEKDLLTEYMVPGITQEEADALIAKIMAVCSFPSRTASEAVTED